MFPTFLDLHWVSIESKSLKNGFGTLSRLKAFNDFVICVGISLNQAMSCCQIGSMEVIIIVILSIR